MQVLLVGLEYSGRKIAGVTIETRGLCRSEIAQTDAAAALYDYDVIIINPASYSHFIFGHGTSHSDSEKELWDLKHQNNNYDLDTIFDPHDRSNELDVALRQGSRLIWLASLDKRIQFFGWRSSYLGYLSKAVGDFLQTCSLHAKRSKRLSHESPLFPRYFECLERDGWSLCWNYAWSGEDDKRPLATTPEGYWLGNSLAINASKTWLLTPPTSQDAVNALVMDACSMGKDEVRTQKYHGMFLSHTSDDKPFVRRLAKALREKGVEQVWVDEAEIQIGDSLIAKIQDGIQKSEYFGIVLSPRSVTSSWVQRELEQAMMMEIQSKSVKVLPLLYEACDLPGFLSGKLYADFQSEELFNASLEKLLRRLQVS